MESDTPTDPANQPTAAEFGCMLVAFFILVTMVCLTVGYCNWLRESSRLERLKMEMEYNSKPVRP